MKSWCPITDDLPDSSVWDEPYPVRVLWISMLALKNSQFVVLADSAYKLARRANMKEQEVIDALNVLSSPDIRRGEDQKFEGRRIEKVEGGWLILNGEKYRDLIAHLTRREYKNKWERDKRAALLPPPPSQK